MSATTTAGKVWAGNATHGVQGFFETPHLDPGELALGEQPAEDPQFDWERIESLMGDGFHLNPERTASLPRINVDENVAQMTRKLMSYVAKTQDLSSLTDDEIATLAGYECVGAPMEDRLRRAFKIPDDERIVTAVDEKGAVTHLSLGSAFSRTGRFRGGYSTANLAQKLVCHTFEEQFTAEHPELDPATVASLFRRLEDKQYTGKKWAHLWDESRVSPEVLGALTAAGGPDVKDRLDTMTNDEMREMVASLPVAEMFGSYNGGYTNRPAHIWTQKLPYGIATHGLTMEELESELSSTNRRSQQAATNRAYRGFLEEQMQVEYDFQLQRGYIQRTTDTHSATVFEQKKNVPQSHLDAGDNGYFRTSGDFRHVELDSDTDLGRIGQVEKEYGKLRSFLPQTSKVPALRFRKTGRHHALGVYHPHADNIAVDPRHPSSFVHEFIHHVDHTVDGKNVSSGDDFRPLLRQVQAAISKSDAPLLKQKAAYYQTPTEVLSRSAELYFHWKQPGTSLNGDDSKYGDNPGYTTMLPMRDQIVAFWDKKLVELGAQVPQAA